MSVKSLYLDSADLCEIEMAIETGVIKGVTTNPSLIAKTEKGNYEEKLRTIADNIKQRSLHKMHLSVEVISDDPKEMESQARVIRERLHSSAADISAFDMHVKIPITFQNLGVIDRLSREGIRINATACMTAQQAKLAMEAGASAVSFFFNRMKDHCSKNPWDSPENEISAFAELSDHPLIICGSIRKQEDVMTCWKSGADVVTASLKIIQSMASHPETDKAIRQFKESISTWLV